MRKILISAYACEPFKGSEQAVGWNIVLQLAKNNDVHVITRANNQQVIDRYLEENDNSLNLHFHYYDTPEIFLSLKNKEKGIYLYYILWQIGIIKKARKLLKTIPFDYAFHLTFGSVWLPTFLFLLPTKFIWGPLGGGEQIPDSFIKTLSLKGRLLQYLKKVLSWTIYINPLLMLSAKKAEALLCRTENTIRVFPKMFRHKCHILTDGAIEPDIFSFKHNQSEAKKISLITTSRLIHTKNIETIIKSISLIPKKHLFSLTIIGSGPEEDPLKRLIKKLDLTDKIEIIGFMPRNEVFKYLSNSDIYLFASLKEACNLSLLEAMAIGLPVICLNWTGMALSTDDTCAIRLPVTDPEQMPKDMAAAITALIENSELREQMGMAGRKRIQEVFNWEAKGKFLEELLDKLENKK